MNPPVPLTAQPPRHNTRIYAQASRTINKVGARKYSAQIRVMRATELQ